MAANATDDPVGQSLRGREPAFASLRECVLGQETAAARGPAARLFGRSPLHPEARTTYRAAIGELNTADALRRLGPDWTVLHAVPVASTATAIDHVAVGPAGVFAITTRDHSGQRLRVRGGTLLVGGRATDHFRAARHQAERASRLVGLAVGRTVPVVPVIVVTDPARLSRTPSTVTVLESSELALWLTNRPRDLSGREVAELALAAETSATWRTCPPSASDDDGQEARFLAIRDEVHAARRRSRAWVAAGVLWLLAAAGAAGAILPSLLAGVAGGP